MKRKQKESVAFTPVGIVGIWDLRTISLWYRFYVELINFLFCFFSFFEHSYVEFLVPAITC